jgi:S1-C subfamily serine protease
MPMTNPKRVRHSRLAPLGIELRQKLAVEACNFFSPVHYKKNCDVIGKVPDSTCVRPLAGSDFFDYLKKIEILDEPLKHLQRIRQLLERMAAAGILVEMGPNSNVMMPKFYFFLKELTNLEAEGLLWLAPALGDDFLFHQAAPGIAHIIGVTPKGDASAGTGIIFHSHHILTCAHVVNGMTIDKQQVFQGSSSTIEEYVAHPKIDIAVIRVAQALKPVPGLSFLPPTIAQPVFTLGYPKIPFARTATLTIQRGEVTNESITTLDGHRAFLYSAIARPGNSGGPVISSDGHVVGITMQDLTEQGNPYSPHYAGIPSQEIASAINDFGLDVQIPFEEFE